MEIKAYTCPQCGAPLNVEEGTTFTQCQSCGSKIKITYSKNEIPQAREFITPDGIAIASAIVPESYELEAKYNSTWQSEMVPFIASVSATSSDHQVYMSSFSKEIFHDLRNPFLTTIMSLVQCHTNNGYRKFLEPEDYLKQEAEKIAGGTLTPVAKTTLPSALLNSPDTAKQMLDNDIYAYGLFMEMQPKSINSLCESVLYKYSGKLNDRDIYVLAGMDYEGAELVYSLPGLDGLGDMTEKALNSFREAFKKSVGKELPSGSDLISSFNNVMSGKDKMTMKDYMNGGLLGKMMREKREKAPETKEEVKVERNPDDPIPFGHSKEYGKHVDHVLFGVQRSYFCMYYAEKENEANSVFGRFVATIAPDPSLAQRENQLINNKLDMIRQQANRNQAMAQQKMLELQRMQARTSQMIADNARHASDGLMDSWRRKMDSDSRISSAYSEAIRGVNTYTTTDGRNVEVSTVADHVYQNSYGDVYGVSGNALDQSLLNNLNWTELKK